MDLDEVIEGLELLKPWIPEKARKAIIASQILSGNDAYERLRPLADVVRAITIASGKGITSLPDSEELEGEIYLGDVMLGDLKLGEFRLKRDDLIKGVTIFAPSGHGKTNLIMQLLLELSRLNIPFTVFDFKQDYRHLIRKIPNLVVLKVEWLRCNLLDPPPNVNRFEWLMEVANLLPYSWGFFHWGTGSYLTDMLMKAFNQKEDLTLFDIYELVKQDDITSRRKADWHDVLESRLSSTLRTLGKVIATKKGYPIYKLLKLPLVIELYNLREADAKLIVSWFLAYELHYRRANRHRGRLYHVNVIDEYHRVVSRQHEWSEMTKEMGDSIIERQAREFRDFGEAGIYAFQEISRIHHSVIENSELKICGNLSSWEDIEVAASSMNLKEEEVRTLDRLQVGEWLVKRRGGSAFILRAPLIELQKDLGDEELQKLMKDWIAEISSYDRERITLSEEEVAALQVLSRYPFASKSTLYRLLKSLGRLEKRVKALRLLIKKGLVSEEKVFVYSTRPTEFLIPTEKGLKLMKASGIETKVWERILKLTKQGHGFKHACIVYHAWRELNKLGRAWMEHKVGEKQLDVFAVINGVKLGIEVYVNPKVNLEKLSTALRSLDLLMIVSYDTKVHERIKNEIMQVGSLLEKVVFYTSPPPFFKDLKEGLSFLYQIGRKMPERAEKCRREVKIEIQQQE